MKNDGGTMKLIGAVVGLLMFAGVADAQSTKVIKETVERVIIGTTLNQAKYQIQSDLWSIAYKTIDAPFRDNNNRLPNISINRIPPPKQIPSSTMNYAKIDSIYAAKADTAKIRN